MNPRTGRLYLISENSVEISKLVYESKLCGTDKTKKERKKERRKRCVYIYPQSERKREKKGEKKGKPYIIL
jgi:hypothetical protein